MLKITEYQDVVQFRLGPELMGQVAYWCAAYLVDGLLVDAGCASCADEFTAALQERRVDLVVNTHHHEDHTGANARLAAERGVRLLAPAASLELIQNGFKLYPYQQMIWWPSPSSRPEPLGHTVSTPRHTYQVIPTPGHSQDHVILWEPDTGRAFTGDLFIAENPKTCRTDEVMSQTLPSLRRLRDLGPKVMFTGLGQIVEDATAVLERTIAYLEECRERFREMSARGLTPEQIVEQVYGRESGLKELTQGQMSYENFVSSLLA